METLTGDWQIEIQFVRGSARHAVRLEQTDAALQGRYRSQFAEHELHGRVEGDSVAMEVGIHYQRCGTTYAFRGTAAGDTMQGEVGLGEYGSARWEARRRG
jgi:hypothetical protein